MKKLLSLVLAFVMLFTLVSCVKNDQNENHNEESSFYYPALSGMTETPTRILYTLNDTLYYYNKIEEESYVFCFDPLCHHDNYQECISLRFMMNGTNSVIRYCAENNRFYALRGQKLFSFSFDGSDLREEYSFGEDGGLDSLFYDSFSSMDLNIFENNVYFITFDMERGTRNLMRLDINTGKTENLSAHLTEKLVSYSIADGCLYLNLQNGKESGVYRADMNLENMTKLSDSLHPSMTYASVWNEKQYFYINYENKENKNVPVSIMAYSPETDTETKIFEITDGIVPTILAASETELYFIKSEPTAFGTETVRGKEKEVYNAFSKIYKLSIADGVCEPVMNDLSCEVSKLYFLDNSKVLILGQYCEGGEGTASKTAEMFTADIGKDGNFKNVHILEENTARLENLGNQNESTESSAKYPPATVPLVTTETLIPEIPTLYVDTFEAFMRFPGNKGYFFDKIALERYEIEGSSIVFFRVIEMEEEYVGDFMIYLVQIVDIYGVKNYDTEKVYRMAWRGHLEDQLYGRPPLEIGKTYAQLMALNEGDLEIYNLWQAGLIYDVKEENGKRYLYPYGTDLSIYDCKIPITDPEENSIYKKGKHDKAIAKLEELGESLPTFDYKVEAKAFFEELN